MPFGRAGTGEFGTYFIGYCRTPRVIEQMIENMFVGRPPGNCELGQFCARTDENELPRLYCGDWRGGDSNVAGRGLRAQKTS